MSSRFARWAIDGGALALVVLVVYVLLAPEHVVDGDNAELSAVGAIGGRPHPSGYPAYVLYLRATSWLPGATPAHTAAIATALLAALAVYVLHAACRAWGARPAAATIAVAIYAASPVVLRMHTEAEVFAPNALVVALVLWLSATAGPLRGVARIAALGLVAGLGLANHLTCVLVAPVGLYGAIRGVREGRSRPLAIAAGIGALALGLSAYAYLLVADGPISFGRVDGFGDIVDFFLRTDYGGPGAFVPGENTVSPIDSIVALAATLGRGWLWLPALAGIAWLGMRIARPAATGETRLAWALLATSFVVAGPLLALRFNIPPEGLGLYVVQRFHLLPLLLLAIPVACAFDRLGDRLAVRIGPRSPAIASGAGVVVFAALVVAALPWLRAVHSPAMELGIRNLLRSLPPRAVVVVNSEDLCFGADYVQHVTGERLDVVVACWIVTSRQWYRDRLADQGVPVSGEISLGLIPPHVEQILATGRPLFVDRSQRTALRAYASYPFGTVIRVLPRGTPQPPLHEVVAINRELFTEFDLDYPRPGHDDDYAAVAHRRYAITWTVLSEALQRAGDPAAADDAMALAAQLAPEPP